MITKENFGETAESLLPSLYRIAYSVTRNRQDAEDVVQEGLIKAYTKLHLFDEARGTFYAWINSIVYFSAIDLIRKRRPHYSFDDSLNAGMMSAEYHGVVDAIKRLPQKSQVVIGCLANGLSNQEIADRLGVTYNNATVMIHRARERLRKEI